MKNPRFTWSIGLCVVHLDLDSVHRHRFGALRSCHDKWVSRFEIISPSLISTTYFPDFNPFQPSSRSRSIAASGTTRTTFSPGLSVTRSAGFSPSLRRVVVMRRPPVAHVNGVCKDLARVASVRPGLQPVRIRLCPDMISIVGQQKLITCLLLFRKVQRMFRSSPS